MFTEREQKVVKWMEKRKVATMRHLRYQFQISHMTVIRALKKYGYYTSYNHNGAYYVLQDLPEFDEWGLWAYRDIRFSRYGTIRRTIIALIEDAPAGLTVAELEDRLQAKVANLASRLVRDGAIQREILLGRQAVYLVTDAKRHTQQHQERQQLLQQPAVSGTAGLPKGCSPTDVIEVLRLMILVPDGSVDELARQLRGRGVHITADKILHVIDYYALKKKRRSSR